MRKLGAREQFKIFSPEKIGTQSKDLVDMRWALTWRVVAGEKTVKARLVA